MSTEQEYDAEADMLDNQDPTESGPGPYPEPFTHALQPPHQLGQPQSMHQQQLGQQSQTSGLQIVGNSQGYNSMTQLLDPFDPMLDLDPFGLSASM